MNTEDKVKELIDKFSEYSHSEWNEDSGYDEESRIENAKQCAIICVDEILDVLGEAGVYSFADPKVSEYWKEVKDKINQL